MEVGVDDSNLLLKVLDGIVELFSLNWGPSEDSSVESEDVWLDGGVGEVNELIDLCALEVGVAVETVGAVSGEESSDGS